jgi:SAM-dependent methyltransferase
MGKMKHLGGNRSSLLVHPLSAVHISRSSPVLCIGPRSEGELLNLKGFGFRNVRGLDLITYSPWIDLGDMHAMPYADNAFGILVMGWVLAYSHSPGKAAQEAVRITRNGGLIAVGVEARPETAAELAKAGGYEVCDIKRLESVAEILKLFVPHVDRVFFNHDAPTPLLGKWQLLVIFSVKK